MYKCWGTQFNPQLFIGEYYYSYFIDEKTNAEQDPTAGEGQSWDLNPGSLILSPTSQPLYYITSLAQRETQNHPPCAPHPEAL